MRGDRHARKETESDRARALLVSLRDVDLESYSVVGNCLRFEERSRNDLKEFRQRVTEAFLSKSPTPKNFLLWGLPGSGKSYLVQQVAKSLSADVYYLELNLSQLDQESFRVGLEAFVAAPRPGLCFIDEVDARSDQVWPYETLLAFLEPPTPRPRSTVFCLAGSGGRDLRGLAAQIRTRPKGSDLLSRIPRGNEFTVASLGVGDKVLVSMVQLVLAAREEGHAIHEIEKLALFYLAVHPDFTSARQLRSRAAQCAQRIPPSEDRVRYDFLFRAGDPENKQFWKDSDTVRKGLEDSFVRVTAAGTFIGPAPARRPEYPASPGEAATGPSVVPRIAVLPLANISPDPRDEYFADGLTEELTSVLSQIRGVRVIARTSVGQYKGATKSVAEIGAELGVTAVVEGSVRKSGDQLRITVQLIDVGTQEHRWAETYDRRLENVFAIQAEVAERMAEALKVQLIPSEREAVQGRPTSSIAAYELYLRGLQAYRRELTGAVSESEVVGCFEGAIREDPGFSAAYSYLANYLIGTVGGTRPGREVFPRVRDLVAKAIERNPNSSDAHTALGNLALQADLDWARAEAEFQQAFQLNPSNVDAHFWYGVLLVAQQRFDPAKAEFRAAIQLDPLMPIYWNWLASCHALSGEVESATAVAERQRNRDPTSPLAHLQLAGMYLRGGRLAEALREVEQAGQPVERESQLSRAILLARLGRPETARALAKELQLARASAFVPWEELANLYASLGENEQALDCLDRELREGDRTLWVDYQFPQYDAVRADPRFVAMLRALGLPTLPPRQREVSEVSRPR